MSLKRVSNPPHRWHPQIVEWLDGPPAVEPEVFEEQAKSIVNENESPDVGFRFSANPYRGCFHACAYCYARPTHQYWDFGAGTDFDRKIIVKTNAPELLRATFEKKSWAGETVLFSGNTDCYQPLEARYELTRRCLDVCREYRNPVALVTKAALIRRDLDLCEALVQRSHIQVTFSIPFVDDAMARLIEPGAPRPSARFAAMAALSAAGVAVGVNVAPIIPGLNDDQVAAVLEKAKACGASRAARILLRLPAEVAPVFFERLQEAYPDRVEKVRHAIMEMRAGRLNCSQFGERMSGHGERWKAIDWLFQTTCQRLGLMQSDREQNAPATFRRPGAQLELF